MARIKQVLELANTYYQSACGGSYDGQFVAINNGTTCVGGEPDHDHLARFLVAEIVSAWEGAKGTKGGQVRGVIAGLREAAEEIREVAQGLEDNI